MLDIAKLARQMPQIGQQMQKDAQASLKRLEMAQGLFSEANKHQDELIKAQEVWGDRMIFSPGTPVESLDTAIDIPDAPPSHSVFSSDGSQIAPSHHEIIYCYLINIGRIMLHYGQNFHPLLDSIPEIYYKTEDLYGSRKWGIRTEEWMGYLRTMQEVQVLTEMACTWVNPPGAHFNIPNLAMTDGSLVYWFLDNLPTEAREEILNPVIESWEQLRQSKIPLVGYISASRSIEVISFLRLMACPYEAPNCNNFCSLDNEKNPCQKVEPLRDTSLWNKILQPRQRSAIFRSNSRILDCYPESQKTHFCYLHGGVEVARVEFPQWIAEDSELLNQALSITLTQIDKGFGYPVALAEAHNLAVIKGGDRTQFFSLIEDQMLRYGVRNVGVSYKEARKRGSIA
ncbi:DNA double-strand break repair nuclease NurA [Cyanobacterium sp. IPPAS B-1200]|uniref:DNA double-strand break repair nuclease NurA n=1 Tax=Cyanobacterium sp. IPPAS B-1200 TaxID=1562720 RepID=UPI000852613E|nr:DNA double-strand break repair nuclease NurA [Cyanobacterium sp. IPPAS B-1200]OEJ77315.1 nuclease [Cyanobacterium sp. IPPAS B-1200]